MKIDFCPNKRRLILLSCPLQLISIDSRSPSGLRQAKRHRSLPDASFQFTQPKRAATGKGKDGLFVVCSFNSRSPSGLRLEYRLTIILALRFNSRSPSGLRPRSDAFDFEISSFNSRSPSGLRLSTVSTLKYVVAFQFTQPKRAATAVRGLSV